MQLKELAGASRHFRIAIATALITMAPLAPGAVATAQSVVEPPVAQPAASGTLDRIRASGKLVLGYRTDAQPLSYKDTSGQAAGYAVTLCQKVADGVKSSLGLSTLAVEWVADAQSRDLEQGNVDLLCDGSPATLTDRATVSFSIPIFPGGIAGLLRTDASEQLQDALEERPPPYQLLWRGSTPQSIQALQRKTVSIIGGTALVDLLTQRMAALRINSTIALVDSYDAGVAKVVDGSSDLLFGDRAELLDLAKRSSQTRNLRVLNRHFTFTSLALVLKRNDDDFRLVVDRALSDFYALPAFGDTYTASFGPADADTVQFFRMTAISK